MQRILNALLQFRNPILYFFLLTISLSITNNRSAFHEYTLEKYGFYFSSKLYAFQYSISNYFNLGTVNRQLLEENEKLKAVELEINKLPLYPGALIKPQRFPYKLKKATVLKNSFQNQRNFILINQGSSHGIRPEMGVISNNGIVGIVHSVSKNYANVISVLHQDLKINVRTTKSPAFGSLVWKGGSPLEFKIEDIVTNANIHVGDTIITGGMSFYFPLGIPIGHITHLEKNEENGYFSIDAQLFNDPSQVYYVYVLENQDFEELESLQKNIVQ